MLGFRLFALPALNNILELDEGPLKKVLYGTCKQVRCGSIYFIGAPLLGTCLIGFGLLEFGLLEVEMTQKLENPCIYHYKTALVGHFGGVQITTRTFD